MKTIGIVAHSFEGAALRFLEAGYEGARRLGREMHPEIALSAIPMGLSTDYWEEENRDAIAFHLKRGIQRMAAAGADFYICPDNSAHIVLEEVATETPIPGLHICDPICAEIKAKGWQRIGLLGTESTMSGPVYRQCLAKLKRDLVIASPAARRRIDAAILEELCRGRFLPGTNAIFGQVIDELKAQGADCVILSCTEIPLIVTENSSIPVLDSTRLLARAAVIEAIKDEPLRIEKGWIAAITAH